MALLLQVRMRRNLSEMETEFYLWSLMLTVRPTPVSYTHLGAGDNAAAAVGTGTVGDGGCNISLGTSGTIFISSKEFGVDRFNALHSFDHADGNFHLMGCMLSAASCNKWRCV